ncbi:MAG TPA: hypothetical protein VJY54_06270 [Lachnospiraceae bacterium]|nr:hypothetical protein [Lachnospiraceae bacterium]
MRTRKDYLAIITIALLVITSVVGILSLNFGNSYNFINQYGQPVQIYGYGIYAYDTYFQAPISIGTDIGILLVLVPLFIYTYFNYVKKGDKVSQLKLISVYSVALYYAVSIAFGLTYNRLFLVYVALFACSLFGMFKHISNISLKSVKKASKGLKIFLIISGIALIVAWLPDVIPTILNGTTLQIIGVYTTCITYVLDMGVIAPLCFITIFLLKKDNPLGMIVEAVILKLCIIIAFLMFSQMFCQIASGCELPIPVTITKNLSFVLLGGFAFYFNRKMYRGLEDVNE